MHNQESGEIVFKKRFKTKFTLHSVPNSYAQLKRIEISVCVLPTAVEENEIDEFVLRTYDY